MFFNMRTHLRKAIRGEVATHDRTQYVVCITGNIEVKFTVYQNKSESENTVSKQEDVPPTETI